MTEANDETMLRRAFAVAQRSRDHGNHPFGAILVGPKGEVLIETENSLMPARDMTAHAERLLATAASKKYDAPFLAECTMYTSAEPCAMCAGAVYWAGIGRVVYGASIAELATKIGQIMVTDAEIADKTPFADIGLTGGVLAEESLKLFK
jgi:tRNA(Arg) A34 adenosine deaminase TadA